MDDGVASDSNPDAGAWSVTMEEGNGAVPSSAPADVRLSVAPVVLMLFGTTVVMFSLSLSLVVCVCVDLNSHTLLSPFD